VIIRALIVAVCCMMLGAFPAVGVTPMAPHKTNQQVVQSQPNIVLITTDDQRLSDMAWMPQTRQLLGEAGVSFNSGLSPHPLCCPARAEILTGQYAHNNGVYNNQGLSGGYSALIDPSNHVGRWLQEAGYQTGFVGKFVNGYEYERDQIVSGWDWFDPTIRGVYDYIDFIQANNGTPESYVDSYITDVVSTITTDLISRWSGTDTPFFIWASYVAPHTASRVGQRLPIPEPEYAGTAAEATNIAEQSPAFNEADMRDKPEYIRDLPLVERAAKRQLFQHRVESLASVDDAVAATIAALDAAGELENTLIIFTTDNGYLIGEHRYTGKNILYEEGLLVPFLMRGPGIPANEVSPRPVTLVDIAPTMMDAAGDAPAGRLMDGASFLDSSGADVRDPDRAVLVQIGENRELTTDPLWRVRGLRTSRYTYAKWSTGFEELYDRRRDPWQLNNQAGATKYAEITKLMRRKTRLVGDCAGPIACAPRFSVPRPSRR
jgi:N-acetylglucosamine-6-sulfatase